LKQVCLSKHRSDSPAAELDAAVFVHPWDMMGMDSMSKYWLPWLVGMPAETSRAICSVIFGGLLEKLPNLKICFAHGGGSFPATIGRIDHGFGVRPDLCALNISKPPSSYLGKFWVDSLVHDPQALEHIVQLFGQDKVCLGSDYPFPLGEHHPGSLVLSHPNLSEETKHKILWKNAVEFLGLNEEQYLPRQ
jgi:aminocarboxymuconate-semialdehyde decarboxylase